MTACNRFCNKNTQCLRTACWQRWSACGKDIILPSASAPYTMCAYVHTSLQCFFSVCLSVCVCVCALRSPSVAQGQTWLAMLRFCGHPDQQITGLWLRMGCKSSNKPHGWRGMLKQMGSRGYMRLQPMQFAFTGRTRSLEEMRGVPVPIVWSYNFSAFHTLKPRTRVVTESTKKHRKVKEDR